MTEVLADILKKNTTTTIVGILEKHKGRKFVKMGTNPEKEVEIKEIRSSLTNNIIKTIIYKNSGVRVHEHKLLRRGNKVLLD